MSPFGRMLRREPIRALDAVKRSSLVTRYLARQGKSLRSSSTHCNFNSMNGSRKMPWPVSENYVEDCESALGFSFPESYRIATMDQNGGAVVCDGDTWNLHPIWDKSDKKRLKRTSNDVVRETKAMANWTGWPGDAVCIAANGTGDVLIFSGRSSSLDKAIHRWNHETGETEKVANDFSELQRV